MSDLIDRLSENLKPIKPLRLTPLWSGAGVGVVAAALVIWFIYGPRPELSALTYGNWSGTAMPLVKPGMFLAIGLTALWAVGSLARPQGRLKMRYLLPLLVISGVTLGGLMVEYRNEGWDRMMANLGGGVVMCYSTILGGGLTGFALLWALWLRRSATAHPATLGAMAGLATGALTAAAYALHCQGDAPVYLLLVYGMAVAIFTGLAAIFGAKMLKW